MASFPKATASLVADAHEVTEIPDMNPARKAASGKTGMCKGTGVEYGLGEFEKITEGPKAMGLSGGDNFGKNNVKDANGTVSTDRGKFEQMV